MIGLLGVVLGATTSCGASDQTSSQGPKTTIGPVAEVSATTRLRTPPVPKGQAASGEWTVKARVPGGAWHDVGVYAARVDLNKPAVVAMALLDADGPVEISVTRRVGALGALKVRPASAGVRPVTGTDLRTATFTVTRPTNVSIEPDGDTHANLQLFVNPIDRTPVPRGRRVITFGPGVHNLPRDHTLRVPSHTTVVLAAGAVVHGTILIRRARDVIVTGSGVIDPSPYFNFKGGVAGVFVDGSSDVGIKNITILRGQNGTVTLADARDVVVAGLKVVTADRYSDGIDIAGSHRVLIVDCFMRTSDDSIAIWATNPYIDGGSTTDLTVRHTTLWPDLGHGVLAGPFGKQGGEDMISGIDFQDVDVLEQYATQPQYQGALALNAADDLTIRRVRFNNIRLDHITEGQAMSVRTFTNPDYNTTPGRSVHDILFRDISVPQYDGIPSNVSGYDDQRTVANVLFENVRRGPIVGFDQKSANIDIGDFTSNVTIEPRRTFAVLDDASASLTYSSGWTTRRVRGAYGGRVHTSSRRGARLTVRVSGRQVRIIGPSSPSGGQLAIYLDGMRDRTVDTYSGTFAPRRVLYDGSIGPGRHTVELRVLGRSNLLSAGHQVSVDTVEVVGRQ